MNYNEIIAGFQCPLCGFGGQQYGTKDGHILRACGEILLSWQWSDVAEYEAMYTDGQYHTVAQISEGQRISTARDDEHVKAAHSRLETLENIMPGGTLLDVGAGTGAFVDSAGVFGYEAIGFDPCPKMVEWAQGKGRNVHLGTWQEVAEQGATFDVITLHDVWEHLVQPIPCLQALRECLNTDGLMVIELPEWGCPQAKAEGLAWKHVRPMQHLFLPADAAAQEMFKVAGLRVESLIRPMRGKLGKICYYLSKD